MKTNLTNFMNLFPVSKTLRFELKPQGKTLESIIKAKILDKDIHRSESYAKVKKIIDRYHKAYIDERLTDFNLSYNDYGKKDSLVEYYFYYRALNNDRLLRDEILKEISQKLRNQIAGQLTRSEEFKTIDKKELIKNDLMKMPLTEQEISLIGEFNNFTSYFSGFHENRKNMYTAEEQSTAIAFRLINQNLPTFIDNIIAFEKIKSSLVKDKLPTLYADLEAYLNIASIEEVFELSYYTNLLTQKQIEVYNTIIGGKSNNEKDKIKGLNEYVNLFNQTHTKAERLPKLKPLYKQILSDRDQISFLPESFNSDNDMLEAIKVCYEKLKDSTFDSLKYLLQNIKNYDLNGIFIPNDNRLTSISQHIFGSWAFINSAIEEEFIRTIPSKKKETKEDFDNRISKAIKQYPSFSIAHLNEYLNIKCKQIDKYEGSKINLEDYFISMGAVNTELKQDLDLFTRIDLRYAEISYLLSNPYPEDKKLSQEKEEVEKIKAFLDSLKELQRFLAPLLGKGEETGRDLKFYNDFSIMWDDLDVITPLYNMVRNKMTEKAYSNSKIKINFENPTLLNGWDLNKERDNSGIILRKNGLYYLAIMAKGYSNVFDSDNLTNIGECYQKMEYKLLPGANKMLPKVFFSKSRIDEFAPNEQIIKKYNEGTHKKGDNFSIGDCHNLIDFFKSSIEKHEDWKKFNFNFSKTNIYKDLSDFYKEVEQQGYKITFRDVSVDYISELVESGKLYLFQIYNKDFSLMSKGTPNLHTMYWKALFDKKNLENVVYKLNGEAEVFYRKRSINNEQITVHPANYPISNKNEVTLKKKPTSTFKYDLIKDRRYTVDKFQFNVPITMNFKSSEMNNINLLVNEYLKNNENAHVIGIDRGERHLLYLTMIDRYGRIVKQYSLNDIINEYNGEEYHTNYHSLLKRKQDKRALARQSWKTIESIKELKEGYLSQVIHKIAELVVEYNAIVVLEDLNFGFIKSRQKFEKQVYQKFEKMLIDKLNYLVDKKKDDSDIGGVLNAYQLTNKFKSFQTLGKQCGFLFYVQAWNTSKIDPLTGFVNLFDTSMLHYESIVKSSIFFSKFDSIRYNPTTNMFEFKFDYNNFTTKAAGSRTNWTLCTYGNRIITTRDSNKNNEWVNSVVNITDEFKSLFLSYNVDINSNLKDIICTKGAEIFGKKFFEDVYRLLRLTLQMRNSKINDNEDYILSPVANAYGKFFNSSEGIEGLPMNADANGAYNIARKGLWILDRIDAAEDISKFKVPAISNKEWLMYAQQMPYIK